MATACPVGDQQGIAFDQQVEWMWVRGQRREGVDGAADVEKDALSAEMAAQ